MIGDQTPLNTRRICELVTGDVYKGTGLSIWHRVERLLPNDTMLISTMQFSGGVPYWYKQPKPVSHRAKNRVEVRE